MNEHISTSPHSYVVSYGMSREPFSNEIEDDLFYAEPTRKQKLDILLHLTQYGNELMLVTGPEGSGKTTLLQQFQRHALDIWKVARIEAKNGIDERKLVQQLFHQMGLEFHGATHAELLEHLEHHFDSLQHSARQAVMLIDDAEYLPVTALKTVLTLAGLTSKNNKPLLRIILFGDKKLEENFADPLLDQYSNIVHRNIELTAFDSEQTAHYILHRLSAAHFAENKRFTDSAIQKIHKQSHGWPGNINQLAHNLLVESAPIASSKATKTKTSKFSVPRAIAAAIGITAISALILFQDEFNTWIDSSTDEKANTHQQSASTQQLEIPPKEQAGAVPTAPDTSEAVKDTEPQDLPADKSADILAKMYGEIDAIDEQGIDTPAIDEITTDSGEPGPETPAHGETTPKQISATASPVVEAPVTAIAIPDAVTPKTDIATAPATVTVKKKATKPAVIASPPEAPTHNIPADLPGHRTDWILQQNPKYYTLQLVAGNDIKTLREFIKRYSPAKPLAVYQSTRKGKPWYGLIHGIYPNKQQAIDAGSRLSKTLRRQKPWVRNLAPLQKELREAESGSQ